MRALLRDAWRAVLPSSFDSKSQIIQYALLPQIKTVVLCVAACGWEFYRDFAEPAACSARMTWRTWLLIVPQALLLVAYFLQFMLILRFNRRLQLVVDVIALLLVPLAFLATMHTVFRASISLCCCTELFCPMSSNPEKDPSTKACALFFSNCYWALLRKVTHFTATIGLLSPLIALRLSVQCIDSQYQAARTHMAFFLSKLKSHR